MAYESRLSITIDTRSEKEKADDLKKSLDLLTAAGVRLTNNNQNVSDSSKKAGAAMGDAGSRARKGASGVDSINKSLKETDSAAAAAAATIRRTLIGAFAGISAMNIIDMADQWGQYDNRIQRATKSTEEYTYVNERLQQSAKETFRRIDETKESFINLSPVLRDMGLTLSQSIDAVDAFSGLLVVNGANAERGAAAIQALAKSMQKGKVDADAWLTIYSTADSIVDALVISTGKSAEEIRKLGAEGKITGGQLAKALAENYATIMDQVRGMPTTVRDAFNNMNTTLSEYIGQQNKAYGITAKMVEGINGLTNNLDVVGKVAAVTAVSGVAFYGTKLAYATQAAITHQIAIANETKTLLLEAQAEQRAAEAIQMSAKQELARANATVASAEAKVMADKEAQASEIARMRTTQQLMTVENALEVQRMKSQISDIGRQQATARMAEIRLAEVALTKKIEAAERSLAATTTATSAAVQAAYAQRTAAVEAYGIATQTVNKAVVATENAAKAASLLSRASSALLTFFTGPAGIAITVGLAAASMLDFSSHSDSATKSLIDMQQPLDKVIEKFRTLTYEQQRSELVKATEAQREAVKKLSDQYKELDLSVAQNAPRSVSAAMRKGLDEVIKSGGSITEWVDNMSKYFRIEPSVIESWVKMSGEISTTKQEVAQADERVKSFNDSLKAAKETVNSSGGSGINLNPTTSEFIKKLQEQLDTLGLSDDAIEKYRLTKAKLEPEEQKEAERLLKLIQLRREQIKATGDHKSAVESIIVPLQQQVSLFNLSAAEQFKLKLATSSLTEAEKIRAQMLYDQYEALQKSATAQSNYASLMDSLRNENERVTDTFKSQIAILDAAGLSAEQYANAMLKISQATISKAPSFGGVDASVGGASGELLRVSQAQQELDQWRTNELEKQASFLSQKLINEQEYADNVLEITRRTNQAQANIQTAWQTATLATFSSVTGDAAEMLKNMGAESSAVYKTMFLASKAASIAQAWINTELAATRALAELGPIAGPPMAAWVRGIGYTSIGIMAATAMQGFKTGGYTGNFGTNEVAGLVHGREFVFDSKATSRIGVDNLEALRSGRHTTADIVAQANKSTSTSSNTQQAVYITNNIYPQSTDTSVDGNNAAKYSEMMKRINEMQTAATRKVLVEELRPMGLLDPNRRK